MSTKGLTPEESAKSMATTKALWQPMSAPEAGMSRAQLLVQRDALRRALKRLEEVKPCCNTCSRFDFVHTCELHGHVPPEFFGAIDQCEDWSFDAIPF